MFSFSCRGISETIVFRLHTWCLFCVTGGNGCLDYLRHSGEATIIIIILINLFFGGSPKPNNLKDGGCVEWFWFCCSPRLSFVCPSSMSLVTKTILVLKRENKWQTQGEKLHSGCARAALHVSHLRLVALTLFDRIVILAMQWPNNRGQSWMTLCAFHINHWLPFTPLIDIHILNQ